MVEEGRVGERMQNTGSGRNTWGPFRLEACGRMGVWNESSNYTFLNSAILVQVPCSIISIKQYIPMGGQTSALKTKRVQASEVLLSLLSKAFGTS
jgi:hypothetical protein